jgi:hypothetical protein
MMHGSTRYLAVVLSLSLGLLTVCQEAASEEEIPHRMDMAPAEQAVKTPGDHAALARHYEKMAAEMDAKVTEEQGHLKRYEDKSYVHGRGHEAFVNHCRLLIRAYKQAAVGNRQMAALHRGMVAAPR